MMLVARMPSDCGVVIRPDVVAEPPSDVCTNTGR